MNKATYTFLPLLDFFTEEEKIFNADKITDYVRSIHIILKKADDTRDPIVFNGELLMFSIQKKRLGVSYFKINTTLTLESTPEEISNEIQRFYTIHYREKSKYVYRKILNEHPNYCTFTCT